MALINYNAILTGNPTKHLMIAYESLKNNCTDDELQKYKALYESQPLSFLLENSRYIFAEPHAGYNFYLEHVLNNPKAFMFTNYETEYDKVSSYLESYKDKMSDEQRMMYESLLNTIDEKKNKSTNIAWLLEHTFEKDSNAKEVYWSIVNSVYSESVDVPNQLNNLNNHNLFFILAPFVAREYGNSSYSAFINDNVYCGESVIGENNEVDMGAWKNFIEKVVVLSKLQQDEVYCEALNSLPYSIRDYFIECGKESISDQLESLSVIHVFESDEDFKTFNTEAFNCFYSTPEFAVNRIFDDFESAEYHREENEAFKLERREMKNIVKDILTEYVTSEYFNASDDKALITGYNYFPENTTIESAFLTLVQEMDGKVSGVVAQHSTTMREDEKTKSKNSQSEDNDDDDEYDSREQKLRDQIHSAKKPERGLTDKIQNKAMDIEAKQMKVHANIKHNIENLSNAGKAITNIPKNVIDSIKKVGDDWEKADVEKRKAYMIEPGYRKKSLKALKLGLMYGTAAYANIALVPVLAIVRHFSNDKDRRIRNELANELDTEIKICEEKISDAAAAGDQKEKYQLMRIKASLEKEALRVKTNSKYI